MVRWLDQSIGALPPACQARAATCPIGPWPPCERAEERPPRGVELGQRGHEAPVGHQLQQRRRLTARNDEAVEVGELSGLPDLDGLDRLSERTRRVHTRERLRVRLEIALERED